VIGQRHARHRGRRDVRRTGHTDVVVVPGGFGTRALTTDARVLDWVRAAVPDRVPKVRDIGVLASRSSRVSGTPEQIADALAAWQAAGIDGINVINATIPGSYLEFIEHVMPELRRRGLARHEYPPGTLRHKIFGHDRLPATHCGARYRGAFAAGA
jgi:alkanesulfonate monooxygenase SsuD/methylene tetrahydromethanopterin reductase-like flavin-dependent oxidoreductase (luciferase family)